MSESGSFRVGRPPKNTRPPLDVSTIVGAARTLLNQDGLHAFTTRRLAQSLGIRSASLYWHVRDKGELLQLLAESICQSISLPSRNLPWDERLHTICHDYRRAMREIRDGAEIMMMTAPTTPKRLAIIDYVFKLCESAGFRGRATVFVASMVNDYVIASVMNQQRIGEQVPAATGDAHSDPLANATPDALPAIADNVAHLKFDESHFDAAFTFGLELLVSGMKSQLDN